MRRVYLAALTVMPLVLTACAPPTPSAVDSGHTIQVIEAHRAPAFQTFTTANGAQLKMSRSPLGRFGGALFETSIGRGPKTFNPLVANDASSAQIGGLMFAGLTETDVFTGEQAPHLAQSVEIKPDQCTYVVTLRQGLTWSDGHPLTSKDVVFTWKQIILQGLGNPSTRDVITVNNQLPTVSALDDRTIVFKTPVPFAPFKESLSASILPQHIVAPVIQKSAKAFDALWGVSADPKSFVVSGPYQLASYESGQRTVLKRNPHYFMVNHKGQHLPYLDQYIIDYVQDQNAELLQFEQGRSDFMSVPGSNVFYVKHLQTPDFNMLDLGPTSSTSFMAFNLNPRRSKENGKPYVNPVHSQWFRNIHFRRAVDWAIQREQMVHNILMGVGQPLFTAESLASPFLNQMVAKGHPADLDKARAELKAAGFRWNQAGQLYDATGHAVEFELLTNAGNLERESVGVAIKEDLAQLGIKVNFKAIDFNVLVGKVDTAQWDAIVLGLTGSPLEPNNGRNVWQSTGSLHLFNQRYPDRDMPGSDLLEPWEKQLDALFEQGARTVDREKRKAIYRQYQQVVADNLPLIYLYSPKSILAVRTRLQNLDPVPLGAMHNLESLYLTP